VTVQITRRFAPVLATLIALAAACTTSSPPTTAPTPAVHGKTLPDRPRTLQVNGIDPCSLVTADLRAKLYSLNDSYGRNKARDQLTSTDCTITNVPNSPGYLLGLRLISNEGADHFLSSPKGTVTTVQGFGAIQQPGLFDPTGNRGCLFSIDTGLNQSLWVLFSGTDEQPPAGGYAAMCAKARVAAESIMTQLLAKTAH
jgi:uncharacterized protein DUF3558